MGKKSNTQNHRKKKDRLQMQMINIFNKLLFLHTLNFLFICHVFVAFQPGGSSDFENAKNQAKTLHLIEKMISHGLIDQKKKALTHLPFQERAFNLTDDFNISTHVRTPSLSFLDEVKTINLG